MAWSTREQRDLMHLLELDGRITAYQSAPERVEYLLDGQPREHVPAFRVRTRSGDAILDTFTDSTEHRETRCRLIVALTEIYAGRGMPYRAFTASQITMEPRFGNAKWLLRERAYLPGDSERLLLTEALARRNGSTVAELRQALAGMPNLHGVLGAMAIRSLIAVDLSAREPNAMRVSLRAESVA